MTPSPVRYARNGDTNIAYRVLGDGPLDLVFVHGWVSNVEFLLDTPEMAQFFERLASFSRVILFDRAGVGMSDRVGVSGALDERIDDLRAVMDAVGSQRAALFGISEGGPMCMLYAATYPERTIALVLFGTFARFRQAEDAPWGIAPDSLERFKALLARTYGTGGDAALWAPSRKGDVHVAELWARFQRMSASPGSAIALVEMMAEIDVRAVLPSIQVPTLVLHRRDDRMIAAEAGRYLGATIPGARYVEFEEADHIPYFGNWEALLGEVEEFLTGDRRDAVHDRVLATVLFVDIVGSTRKLAELGDRGWRELLARFLDAVGRSVGRFHGRIVDTAGDGVFASFDSPARAVRCAAAIRDQVLSQGVEVRAGLHTGECEIIGDKIAGIAVHIGARVAGKADAGEILVSSTVRDLVTGSGIGFEDRGAHELKGVPGEWRLFAVKQPT